MTRRNSLSSGSQGTSSVRSLLPPTWGHSLEGQIRFGDWFCLSNNLSSARFPSSGRTLWSCLALACWTWPGLACLLWGVLANSSCSWFARMAWLLCPLLSQYLHRWWSWRKYSLPRGSSLTVVTVIYEFSITKSRFSTLYAGYRMNTLDLSIKPLLSIDCKRNKGFKMLDGNWYGCCHCTLSWETCCCHGCYISAAGALNRASKSNPPIPLTTCHPFFWLPWFLHKL